MTGETKVHGDDRGRAGQYGKMHIPVFFFFTELQCTVYISVFLIFLFGF